MHSIEWVSLSEAIVRLQTFWGIALSIAEEIVRNVVHGGRVEVRATRRYQLVPQIVTGQVKLSQRGLWTADYENIEIDWRGLVLEGRKLVPSWISVITPTLNKASAAMIKDAIQAVYDEAETNNSKPPNVREIVEPVQTRLRQEGFDATGKYIQTLAGDEEFRKRRRKRGATVKSDRR